jgi:site-specific recombinase XerD
MVKNDIQPAKSSQPRQSRGTARARPVEILEEHEVLALVKACSGRAPTGIRNRALLVILWRAGLRISEALALRPRDLNRDRGSVQVLNGKGGKSRTVGLDPMAFGVIDRWLDARGDAVPRSAPLFCTLQGQSMKPSYVRALLPRLAGKAGLSRRVHAHALRHTFASELAREGVPVNQIQKQLGHSSLAVTSRYLDHISPAELLDTIASRPVPEGLKQLL